MKPWILQDSQEKKPWAFPNLRSRVTSMKTGDYTLHGYKPFVRVERKGWGDYIGCISTSGRWKKFQEGQLQRLLSFEYRCVIVEGRLGQKINFSACKTSTVITRTAHIITMGIPVIFATNPIIAAKMCEDYLLEVAKAIDLR